MGFRDRLLVGLLGLALVAAGLQAGLGWFRFRDALEGDGASDLRSYATLVRSTLDTSGDVPAVIPQRLAVLADAGGRFRVVRDGVTLLEGGGRFPVDQPGWRALGVPLGEGSLLEVALDQRAVREATGAYLRTSLVALLAAALVAVGLAFALRARLLRPLERLRRGSEALARERFPEPLEVPGNDELARLAGSFNAMVVQVRRALERERAFTRYASHELRTPVANLKATVDAVRAGAVDEGALVPVAERAAERLDRTLSGLLALARAPGEREPVAVGRILAAVVDAVSEADRDRLEVRAAAATVRVPRAAVEGAIRNLVDNALRHSCGRVWLSVDVEGGLARVRVRDEGPGVTAETLEHLGEPFRHGRGRGAGTGLGLAYSRQVAEELGGRLELENVAAGGLEARLTLPLGG